MRRPLLGICIGLMVLSCSGAGGGLAPQSIDGMWIANSDGLGSTVTIVLTSKASAVSGSGTYSTGAVRSGVLSVAGTYRAPLAALTLSYDHGATLRLAATLIDNDHMRGKLTDPHGSVMVIEFVRP